MEIAMLSMLLHEINFVSLFVGKFLFFPQVAEWFNAVDTDRSGQIDAKVMAGA